MEAIRFYQRRGLLLKPPKPQGGVRRYGLADVQRVRFIKCAQRLGFRLDEVAGPLELDSQTDCAQARQLGSQKLVEVRARLHELHCLESMLVRLISTCSESSSPQSCGLIEGMYELASKQPGGSASTSVSQPCC
ncbi:MerR family DNA-binding protein [Variovorax sp. PAMC26660]|uniref:MerR family DNA-binding protein n=1 Tax=Variovorax sp. PAMC26660 TaxID=2762322 RepID=UPI00164D267C|nr:MerR family DNA-binding protein [Variovorax sp. PAMC26660]QNK67198.1 MerR family DNA-binding protein [Variovorax sp. PAMC26660]